MNNLELATLIKTNIGLKNLEEDGATILTDILALQTGKQDKLIAGNNIIINADGKTINAVSGEQLRELTQGEALAANKTYKIVYPSVIYKNTDDIVTVLATSTIYYKFLADVPNCNELIVTVSLSLYDLEVISTNFREFLISIGPENISFIDMESGPVDATELHIYEVIQ